MSFSVNNYTTSATITNAQFQALVTAIHAVLAASGQIQATGVGTQIDPATATFPAVDSTFAGYEVWQFNDSQSGSNPMWIKIEYGRGTAASGFSIRVTIASGFNSSGVATGTTLLAATHFPVTVDTGTPAMQVSAGINYFFVSGGMGGSNIRAAAWERTKDASDNPTSKGVFVFGINSGGTNIRKLIYWTGAQPGDETTIGGCLMPSSVTTALQPDGDTAIFPHVFFGRGETLVCSMMGMCFLNDIVAATINTNVTILGVSGRSIFPRVAGVSGTFNWNRNTSTPSASNCAWWIRAD